VIGYLGLGSNVGDRLANLRAAVAALGHAPGVEVTARSSVYETEPQGEVLDQPDFLNAAVRIATGLAPSELLGRCKRIEHELGRSEHGIRHGPRPIDIDMLMLDDIVLRTADLVLPHREVTSRRFVLAPLLEIDPDLALPGGSRLASALEALGETQRVQRVGEL
jgi:2-amino-4-hydroxy-6-hydroxymethyldihydropteridine diphosphokinase